METGARLFPIEGTSFIGECSNFDRMIGRLTNPGAWPRRQSIAPKMRQQVLRRDGRQCRYCGATKGQFHLDHVVPVAAGGQNDVDNLVVACRACNLSKGAKSLDEWRRN